MAVIDTIPLSRITNETDIGQPIYCEDEDIRSRLRDVRWTDENGRNRKQFTVRSFGPGLGCGILDTSRNTFVMFSRGVSRQQAHAALDGYTAADLKRYWKEMGFPPTIIIYGFHNQTERYIYFSIARPSIRESAIRAFIRDCQPKDGDSIHYHNLWYILDVNKLVYMNYYNRKKATWKDPHPRHLEEVRKFLKRPKQQAELRRLFDNMRNSPLPSRGEVQTFSTMTYWGPRKARG